MEKDTQIQDRPECKAALAQFASWRATRKPHSRIPTHLWDSAIGIAEKHGIAKTAKLLQLSYKDVKKRLQQQSRKKTPTASFMTLDIPAPVCQQEYVLEFENRRGDKMKITMKGIQPAELTSIAKGFWRK